jgi:hypothetical protein
MPLFPESSPPGGTSSLLQMIQPGADDIPAPVFASATDRDSLGPAARIFSPLTSESRSIPAPLPAHARPSL